MSTGVGVGSVVAADVVVELHPAIEQRFRWRPDEGAVVAVSHGQHPIRAEHPTHLDERCDRIGQMLEHLMGVDDVERLLVVEIQRVRVRGPELDAGRRP